MPSDLKFTFRRPCLELSGEIGSLSELIGYMQEESASLTMAFGSDMELVVQSINAPALPSASDPEPAKRKPRTPKDAPAAIAPAPLPVPGAAPAPPAADLTIPADGSVPPFLARPAAPTAPAAAPPLPTSAAPPIAPASPPPVGVLGPKVCAALDALKKGAGETDPEGQRLADWLHASGLSVKGATYEQACRVVLMTSDEKLGSVAKALEIAA